MSKLSPQQLKDAVATRMAREGFPEYCVIIDPLYQLEWFHEQIALKLEEAVTRVENGEDVRIAIFMPPRHGKSDTATQKFPSWVLGKHPEWPFIVASYSQDLATDFGSGTRDLMNSNNYRAIFPNTQLRADSQAKAKWNTDKKGGYTAVGVGGAITGRGFKVGIIDDPFKNREEADSEVMRENVIKWYRSTFYTRQEGNTLIVLILTRWHDDDLAGKLLKEQRDAELLGEEGIDKWEVLEFKALAEQDEKHRKKGEALWPAKFNEAKLHKTKKALGSYEFSALYQQNPIDEENQEFKKGWLKHIPWSEVEAMKTRKYATIDSALSKNAKSDFTGVTRNYVNQHDEWFIKCQRYRINSKELVELVFTLHNEGFEAIGIEEGAYLGAIEPFLKEEMESRGVYPNVVVLKHGGTMKETRIRGLIPRYENGKIFHIEDTCSEMEEEEYLRFPKSAHDDAIDSLAYQNQLAQQNTSVSPNDKLEIIDISKNLSNVLNEQEGNIIIAISTTTPVSYVIGNKEGIFYHKSCVNYTDDQLYKEFDDLIRLWKDNTIIIADQVGDSLWLKRLKQDNSEIVHITAVFISDKSNYTIEKWGDGDFYNHVDISKNAAIQHVVEEMRAGHLTLNGTLTEWEPYIEQWLSLYRTWEENSKGEKAYQWESRGPLGFVRATVYFRVALDNYSSTQASVVGASFMDELPTGRIFRQ